MLFKSSLYAFFVVLLCSIWPILGCAMDLAWQCLRVHMDIGIELRLTVCNLKMPHLLCYLYKPYVLYICTFTHTHTYIVGPHSAYSWLCIQEAFLMGLKGQYVRCLGCNLCQLLCTASNLIFCTISLATRFKIIIII